MRKVVNLTDKPTTVQIFSQIFTTVGIVMLFAIAFTFLGLLLASLITGLPQNEILSQIGGHKELTTLTGFKIIQVASQIGTFLLPALLLPVILFKIQPAKFTGLTGKAPLILFVLATVSFFALLPVLEFIISLNQKMELPAFLKDVENWMREKELSQQKLTLYLLDMPTFWHYVVNIFIIAVLPAIAEELFFRGFLQRTIYSWWQRKHIAVIIASIVFSAIHMQFFGFVPRMLLGMLLGYLLVWSGDLKLPILVHFLNNFTSLTYAYMVKEEGENFDINAPLDVFPFYMVVLSAVIGGTLLYILYKYARRRPVKNPELKEEALPGGKWEKVFITNRIYEAEIVAGNLESDGMHAVIINKRDSSYQAFGEVEVYVHEEDAERAKQSITSYKL